MVYDTGILCLMNKSVKQNLIVKTPWHVGYAMPKQTFAKILEYF